MVASNRRPGITHPPELRGSRAWCFITGGTLDTTHPYKSILGDNILNERQKSYRRGVLSSALYTVHHMFHKLLISLARNPYPNTLRTRYARSEYHSHSLQKTSFGQKSPLILFNTGRCFSNQTHVCCLYEVKSYLWPTLDLLRRTLDSVGVGSGCLVGPAGG